MKLNTTELMKFQRLVRALRPHGETNRSVIGLLELLWKLTAQNAPQGDVGKFDNEEIAIALEWDHDPDFLVSTLVSTGWLDEHLGHRLVVHDWSEHAPTWLRGNLARHQKPFIENPTKQVAKQPTKEPPLQPAKQTTKQPAREQVTTLPSLTLPRETTTTVDGWEVVVVALGEFGVTLVDRAIDGAKGLGYDVERCLEILAQFRELPEPKQEPGVLFRWFTMPRSVPKRKAPKAVVKQVNREVIRARLYKADPAKWRAAADSEMEKAIDREIEKIKEAS